MEELKSGGVEEENFDLDDDGDIDFDVCVTEYSSDQKKILAAACKVEEKDDS